MAERLADANRWLDTARPIIRAYFKLDDLDFEIGREMPPGPANTRTADEARRYVRTARRELHEMLDGIRSDFLADNEPPQPRPGASDQEWEERDNISDALAAETLSVADAIKRVEREWNDDFSKGGRP